MDQKVPPPSSPKKESTRFKEHILMAVGGLMFFLSMVISVGEKMSTPHIIKVVGGILGLCIFCVGLYLWGMKPSKEDK